MIRRTMTMGKADLDLPVGYTRLSYVGSVEGGGYVDTEIIPSNTLGFKTTFKTLNSNKDAILLGARETLGDTRYTFGVYDGTSYVAFNTWPSDRISISQNTWYNVVANWENSRTYTINNITKSLSSTIGTRTHAIQIFGQNYVGTHSIAREFSIKRTIFMRDGVIIADMVPCINDNDEVGFYDLVRRRFFGSGNGIPLIAGY